jgi:ABC-2 type transport system permease protein
MVRKELAEYVRTYRLAVLGVLFLLVGLASPILAKVIPELIANSTPEETSAFQLLLTREPTLADAMAQYLKNFGNMTLVVILMTMGTVSGERAAGTLQMLLAKPIDRGSVLLAKLLVPAGACALGTGLAAGGCFAYSSILFGEIDVSRFLLLNLALLIDLWIFVALTLVASVLARGPAMAAGLAVAGWIVIGILGRLPGVGTYTPAGLSKITGALVSGRAVEPVATLIANGAWICAFAALAFAIFRRQSV